MHGYKNSISATMTCNSHYRKTKVCMITEVMAKMTRCCSAIWWGSTVHTLVLSLPRANDAK